MFKPALIKILAAGICITASASRRKGEKGIIWPLCRCARACGDSLYERWNGEGNERDRNGGTVTIEAGFAAKKLSLEFIERKELPFHPSSTMCR